MTTAITLCKYQCSDFRDKEQMPTISDFFRFPVLKQNHRFFSNMISLKKYRNDFAVQSWGSHCLSSWSHLGMPFWPGEIKDVLSLLSPPGFGFMPSSQGLGPPVLPKHRDMELLPSFRASQKLSPPNTIAQIGDRKVVSKAVGHQGIPCHGPAVTGLALCSGQIP